MGDEMTDFKTELARLMEGATPRPWVDSPDGDNTMIYWLVPKSGGTALPIADVYSNMKDTDARLIVHLANNAAAILALVEAAEELSDCCECDRNYREVNGMVKSALARLKGESHD